MPWGTVSAFSLMLHRMSRLGLQRSQDRFRELGADSGNLREFLCGRGAELADGAESNARGVLAGGTEPGARDECAACDTHDSALAMSGASDPVRLVTNALQKVGPLGGAGQPAPVGLAGKRHSLEPLGQAGEGDV